ncbi:MAG TPA: efflux RND transporter permease subunit, partial [Planctomycetota bacterium]|nr:efflux RND transporter permease subunit [Planctomycetota bacterium]
QSRITLEFDINRDIDIAANDVRDKVSRIAQRLPDEADTPVVAKYDAAGFPVMIICFTSDNLSRMELSDYLDRYIVDRFSVLEGVAESMILGIQEQSMRVWLNRTNMAARNITVSDIETALKAENVEYPGGRIESKDREFTVRITRQYQTVEDFKNMVIKKIGEDNYIRLQDVANVEIGPRNQRQIFTSNGVPMVGLGINKQSTANTLSVVAAAKKLMKELEPDLPEGMKMEILRDDSIFIQASIDEVKSSLLISSIIVVFVIFLFLGNLKTSLIPTFTIPIALMGAFIVLYMVNFSINLITLLALVLAIGMVVDDTIVVLENIDRRIIKEKENPLLASVYGTKQIFFAVIATTLVLVAVFMPISLWAGKTGKIFAEFAVAMTAAVCFSSFIALTLAPMLCSKLISADAKVSWIGIIISKMMNIMEMVYEWTLIQVCKIKTIVIFLFFSLCVIIVWGWTALPAEYEPEEDRAGFNVRMMMPEGTNFYAMNDASYKAIHMIMPLIESGEARTMMSIVPTFGDSQGATNRGLILVQLEDWGKRERSAQEIANEMRKKLADIAEMRALSFMPTGLNTRGYPIQFVLGGPDYAELVKWRDIIVAKANEYPGITEVDYDYKETTPQFHVDIDVERANALGVHASVIGSTLETMLGSKRVTTFVDRGQEYSVVLHADRKSRATPTDLSNIYVRSNITQDLIPLDNLVTLREVGDSARLNRYNRTCSITITGNIAPGYTMSDVLAYLEKSVRENLPEYTQISYKGASKDFKQSSGSMYFVFVLALLISYLVLAAQFESFISPFIVMLTVPLGMFGAVLALNAANMSMNIYTQIGIIMLIGLAAKNGILIVEFINQLRDEGESFETAVIKASKMRLRPILMTGISTVAGAIPLLLASGAGAVSRQCLGTVVFFGGFSACILTLYVIPVGYLILARGEKSPKAILRKIEELEKNISITDSQIE